MNYYGLNSDQLGEEVLFNLQPTVSDAAGQSQALLSLPQQGDVPVQSNTNNNTVAAVASVLVVLYLYLRA